MSRKQALSMYLLGTFGQVLLVALLVWFVRTGGVKVDFTSPMGIIAVIVGGLSSALWGSLASISYHQSSFKQVLKDFFQVKDSLANYCLVLVFLLLDFFPFILRLPLNRWSCQWCSFSRLFFLVELKKLAGVISFSQLWRKEYLIFQLL